jgi:hypothetical protein
VGKKVKKVLFFTVSQLFTIFFYFFRVKKAFQKRKCICP